MKKEILKFKLNNNETHYKGFKNYRNWEITNWVRIPEYNNLVAEIAKIIRITNQKRIVNYKPNAIRRVGMVNITPWHQRSEADYLCINNNKTPYWLISSGGSANLNLDYIKAIRSNNSDEREALLESAKIGTWGYALQYYIHIMISKPLLPHF